MNKGNKLVAMLFGEILMTSSTTDQLHLIGLSKSIVKNITETKLVLTEKM